MTVIEQLIINENSKLDITYATYTLDLSIEEFSSMCKINYEEISDDLSELKSIFLLVDNVPVMVYQRTVHNNVTISLDKDNAVKQNKDIFSVSDLLLNTLNIDRSKIQWENEELKAFLVQ